MWAYLFSISYVNRFYLLRCYTNLMYCYNICSLWNLNYSIVDSFVHYVQFLYLPTRLMFTMFNSFFLVSYNLCVIFNLLDRILCHFQILVPSSSNWLFHIKKIYLKNLYKYRQTWSCFEDIITRNTIMHPKFNFEIWFKNYIVGDVVNISTSTCMHLLFSLPMREYCSLYYFIQSSSCGWLIK